MEVQLRFKPTTPPIICARTLYFSRSRSTGKERDTESGNDYFGARYYASSMGRFLGPDPKAASGHPADPQTWNRYVYGGNNPLKFIDPNGMEKQLVVYVNQPIPGIRVIKEGMMNYGHAFIGLKDTVSGVEHRIGFYPKSQGDLAGGWVQNRSDSVAGALKSDDKSDWTVKMTYTLTDDQFKALAADINKQLANPENYNMQTNNCATWVVNESKVAGVDLPQTSGKSEGGTGLDPGDLGQDLRDRGAQLNPSLQSGSGSSGSSGSSSGSSGSSSSSSGSSGSPSPTPNPQQQQ